MDKINEFLIYYELKIENALNFRQAINEIEGSFETFNHKVSLTINNMVSIVSFLTWIDSFLEIIIILVIAFVIYVLHTLDCACERMDDFCCCFCC